MISESSILGLRILSLRIVRTRGDFVRRQTPVFHLCSNVDFLGLPSGSLAGRLTSLGWLSDRPPRDLDAWTAAAVFYEGGLSCWLRLGCRSQICVYLTESWPRFEYCVFRRFPFTPSHPLDVVSAICYQYKCYVGPPGIPPSPL